MLNGSERAAFRDIEKTLADDPNLEQSFRSSAALSPPRRHQTYVEFAAALIIVGAHGAAVFITAVAVAFGLASLIEGRGQKRAD